MDHDTHHRYQATVESEVSTPFPMAPSSPPRDSYWDKQHSSSPASQPHKNADQPIQDAVNNAFDKSNANAQISPELVHQITQAVIQNMRMTGISVSPRSSAASHQRSSASPSSQSAQTPPRDIYTPPPSEPDHGKPSTPEIRLNSLENQSINPQPYGPKMSLEREYPAAPEQAGTEDTSTLEKIWQPLFEADGNPTARLSQFLRGVALHVIEDFAPCHSLVITPAKMKMFFDEVKIDNEVFPWSAAFGGALSSSSLSHCYRDLLCEQHFVQKDTKDKPSIPALTPNGFQTFCTQLIRAYPDEEAQRFAKVLQLYAVNNADDRKERFPKQLPRCLFPKSSHRNSRRDLEEIIMAHPDLVPFKRTRASSDVQPRPPPPVAQSYVPPSSNPPSSYVPVPPPSAPMPAQHPKLPTRDIPPYPLSSTEFLSDDMGKSSKPIERERKPYAAAPGAGKSYEQEASTSGIRRTQSNAGSRPRYDEESGRSRHQRSESSASQGMSAMNTSSRRVARSPSTRRDDGGDDLSKSNSRDTHGERRARFMAAPNPTSGYDDDRRRSLTGAPPPPPPTYGQTGYQTYAPPPPQPRY